MMIGGMCTSVQASLDDLFGQLDDAGVRVRGCSDRAFAKARKGLSYTVFEQLNAHLLALATPRIDAHRWHGLRVVASDGSRLQVATRKGAELEADHYALALYLPGSDLTLHAALGPADASERQLLFEALERTEPDDLLVLDRGFPGRAMAAAIVQQGRHFCLRVDACGWRCVKDFLRSGQADGMAVLDAPSARDADTYALRREPTPVRLIRDVTPTGSVRVLMTSLRDAARYPASAFGALYHQRWRIEEAFKRVKLRLRLEATTGLTTLAFKQDFAAKILADNLHSLLSGAGEVACSEVAAPGRAPAVRPRNRRNRTYAFGALKPVLVGCLLAVAGCLRRLPVALAAIAAVCVRIQPGRTYPRNPKIKPHAFLAYKLTC